MKLNPKYLEYAKSGLFMAFGSITDDNGGKIQIEVTDDQLTDAVELSLHYLAGAVFGPDVYLKKEAV